MNSKKNKNSVGTLFPNQKTKERSPDMTGKIQIQYEDLKRFTDQINQIGDVAQGNLALWFYPADEENGKGPYVSVQLTPPYRPNWKLPAEPAREGSLDDFFNDVHRRTNPNEQD